MLASTEWAIASRGPIGISQDTEDIQPFGADRHRFVAATVAYCTVFL
jgi:hypothetical protein